MKIQKTHNNKKKVVAVFVSAVLVAAMIYGLAAFSFKLWPFTDTGHEATQEQKEAGYDIKEKNLESSISNEKDKEEDTTPKAPAGSDPSPQPTPDPNSGKSRIGMDISAISADKSSGFLYVRAFIQQVTSEGTCTLSMSHSSGKTYSQVVGVQPGPSTSSCKGFNIPLADLPTGTWNITITYDSTSITGSANKEISI